LTSTFLIDFLVWKRAPCLALAAPAPPCSLLRLLSPSRSDTIEEEREKSSHRVNLGELGFPCHCAVTYCRIRTLIGTSLLLGCCHQKPRSVLLVLLFFGCLCTASEPTWVAAFKALLHCEDRGGDRGGLIPALELLPRRQFSRLLQATRSVLPQLLYGHKITPFASRPGGVRCGFSFQMSPFLEIVGKRVKIVKIYSHTPLTPHMLVYSP
jgi:hypothetical protein